MQLYMSHTPTLSHKQDMTNRLNHLLFIRQSCIVRHAQLHSATLSRDKVARATKSREKIAGVTSVLEVSKIMKYTLSCR